MIIGRTRAAVWMLMLVLLLPAGETARADWKETLRDVGRIASEVTLGAEHGGLFYAYDTLAYPNQPIDLTVRLRNAQTLVESIEGARIGFYRDGELLGTAMTDSAGYATVQFIPAAEGMHHLAARIQEVPHARYEELLRIEPVPLLVAAWPKEVKIVVVDLDYTIVGSPFHRVLLGSARPMPGAQPVLSELAGQYRIVYLTHRPDLLIRRSRIWLERYEFPAGPLLVAGLSDISDSGAYKALRIKDLQEAYPNVVAGIGDKVSDAQAYAGAGITAYLIPHYNADKPAEMRELSRRIARLEGPVHVVDDWDQIRQAFFEGKQYPARQYASFLQRLADRLSDE